MDFERYTERARAAVQSAQTSALARGHPQILPEHLVKAMFADRDRLALNLIRAAGGNPELAHSSIDKLLDSHPKSTGGSQPGLSQDLARLFQMAEEDAKSAGDDYVTVERLLLSATKMKNKAADALNAAIKQEAHQGLIAARCAALVDEFTALMVAVQDLLAANRDSAE